MICKENNDFLFEEQNYQPQPEQLEEKEKQEQPEEIKQQEQPEEIKQQEQSEEIKQQEQLQEKEKQEQPEEIKQQEQSDEFKQQEQLQEKEKQEQLQEKEKQEQSEEIKQQEQLQEKEQQEQSEEINQQEQSEEKEKLINQLQLDENKILLLNDANKKLQILDDKHLNKDNNIIFVYCPPKVGSTSLVSSLRLYTLNYYTVIHIHDELMLKILYGIENVTIKDIINYNSFLGKNVIVIDIYRTPIEQKISSFFEKIGSFHFNNYDEKLNTYDINKVINRFNKIFPYLSRHDYYRNIYNIEFPDSFDYEKKYLCVEKYGVKYLKLRLKDSNDWGTILNNFIVVKINTINDYETNKKVIKDLFEKFLSSYKIPKNLLEIIENCDSLKYYYSPMEKEEYLNMWRDKTSEYFSCYNENEYNLYKQLSFENQHICDFKGFHYLDDGCLCVACSIKRKKVIHELQFSDNKNPEKIIHSKSILEYKNKVNEYRKNVLETIKNNLIKNSLKKNNNKKNKLFNFNIMKPV